MTSNGTFSDRMGYPVPGDGQEETSDDTTQARSVADADAENWGDLIQTLFLSSDFLDGTTVDSGSLASRPAAGSTAPRFFVVTNAGESGDQAYLSFNDDTAWHLVGEVFQRVAVTSADSPYAISDGESVWIDASSGTVDVQLPAPSDGFGARVVVVDASNTLTLLRNGTETIEGAAADFSISTERAIGVESDGTNYRFATDTGYDIPAGSITSTELATDSVTATEIATGAVNSDEVGSVSTDDISEGTSLYFTDERAQDAVGAMVDATLSYVDSTPALGVASGGVDTTELAADAVTAAKIAADAVGTSELAADAVTAAKIAADAVGTSELDMAAVLVDAPNGHIPNAALDNGDSAEISVPVPNGETLTVYRWGAYKISDGTTPTGLDVELLDGADTVQATANTTNSENTAGVASHTNSSGSLKIYKLAVANDTGSDIADPGVGAFFAYEVS